MSRITPTIGRVVLYCLADYDVDEIRDDRRRRMEYGDLRKWNDINAGEVYPADVVRTWGDTPDSAVNVQVKLDGNDTLWVTSTSVSEGPVPGKFHWMPFQLGQAKVQSEAKSD